MQQLPLNTTSQSESSEDSFNNDFINLLQADALNNLDPPLSNADQDSARSNLRLIFKASDHFIEHLSIGMFCNPWEHKENFKRYREDIVERG